MNTETLSRVAWYVLLAIGWAIAGYMDNVSKKDHVTFNPAKFGTTVLIGLVAGLIMAARGDELSLGAYEAAAGIAIPIVDRGLNRIMDARRDDAEPTDPPTDSDSTDAASDAERTELTNDSETTDSTNDSETKYR